MDLETKWAHGKVTKETVPELVTARSLTTVPDFLATEGVKEEDMIWWAGLSQYEREATAKSQYAANIAATQLFTKNEGLSPRDAMRKMFKNCAQFGDCPSDEGAVKELLELGFTKEDAWLPWQLHKRCTGFALQCFNGGKAQWFRENCEQFTSMNAFFRSLIRSHRV